MNSYIHFYELQQNHNNQLFEFKSVELARFIHCKYVVPQVIPRTQRVQAEQLRVLPPAEFAPLLIERLERVKRELDNKERLERRLAEVTCSRDTPRA